MSKFGSDPLSFFNFIYREIPPWDVGGPQPAMSALLAEYPPENPILDVGCGSGDLAIHLAKLGHQVVGIDFVDTAIAHAQEKISSLPPETARLLNFQVADALQPSLLQMKFGSVVDSGFLHVLDEDQSSRFIRDLALALRPGGRYYLLAFATEFPIPNTPRKVTEEELKARFTPKNGWSIKDIRSAEFLSRVAPPVAAIGACVERM
ncbi:MAG: class I SAM-dependent methyltransferase [Anaerolineales bacterium]|nr:class I SAM-dependent methyltransferase [Anaerolineales bacterium]